MYILFLIALIRTSKSSFRIQSKATSFLESLINILIYHCQTKPSCYYQMVYLSPSHSHFLVVHFIANLHILDREHSDTSCYYTMKVSHVLKKARCAIWRPGNIVSNCLASTMVGHTLGDLMEADLCNLQKRDCCHIIILKLDCQWADIIGLASKSYPVRSSIYTLPTVSALYFLTLTGARRRWDEDQQTSPTFALC